MADVTHTYTEGAVAGGYWVECACGWLSKYNQTIKARRKQRDRHDEDVLQHKLWYVVRKDGEVRKPPHATKKEALRSVGATTSSRVLPSIYEAGDHFVTTWPSEVCRSPVNAG